MSITGLFLNFSTSASFPCTAFADGQKESNFSRKKESLTRVRHRRNIMLAQASRESGPVDERSVTTFGGNEADSLHTRVDPCERRRTVASLARIHLPKIVQQTAMMDCG